MDINQIWRAALGELELEIDRANFNTWIFPCHLTGIDGTTAVISVSTIFHHDQLIKKYYQLIIDKLNAHGANIEALEIEVKPSDKPKQTQTKNEQKEVVSSEDVEIAVKPKPNIAQQLPTNNQQSPFIRSHTFDTFVVGNNNRLAFTVCQAVAKNPGTMYNPLFLYGGVGLGKTHLMHAIANEILANDPNKHVLYVSCEKFTNEFIAAIQTNKMRDFKEKYRTVDLLLVDDIQFIANKEGSQEEFFHTFNALHQSNRQIVITSDRVPKQIPALEERLSSRFGWGMLADVQAPNLETRIAILKTKCLERQIVLPDEVLTYIGTQIQSNIRELEGTLTRVLTYCDLYHVPPSLTATKEALSGLITPVNKRTFTPDALFRVVAEHFGITVENILSQKRTKLLVYPRQLVMYLMYKDFDYSYPQIGRELGGKDHTTIMYGCGKIEKEMEENTQIVRDLSRIKERLAEL